MNCPNKTCGNRLTAVQTMAQPDTEKVSTKRRYKCIGANGCGLILYTDEVITHISNRQHIDSELLTKKGNLK